MYTSGSCFALSLFTVVRELIFVNLIIIIKVFDLHIFRLEYEQNRDMDSRFTKLESALNTLRNSLKVVEERENELQSAMEKATEEIDHWKMEAQGRFDI